jgi:hypothetical protein
VLCLIRVVGGDGGETKMQSRVSNDGARLDDPKTAGLGDSSECWG